MACLCVMVNRLNCASSILRIVCPIQPAVSNYQRAMVARKASEQRRKKFLRQLYQYGRMNWSWLLAAALLVRFGYKIIEISSSFPNLFQGSDLLASSWPLFILPFAVLLILVPILSLTTRDDKRRKQLLTQIFEAVRVNAPGLLLGLLFFIIYFVLAAVFNRTDFNNDDVFFQADSTTWKLRLADPTGHLMSMRAVHPLAILFLRPLTFGLSLISGVDLFHSLLFLLAIIGGLSVFLVWIFIRDAVGSTNYSFLFASLFGISTAQLVFNTIVETYVFSSLLLILFFVLLQKKAGPAWLILTGIGIFGITISNLVQVLIGLFLTDFKIKRTLLLALTVVAAAAALNLLNKAIYPPSGIFFFPADYGAESRFFFRPSKAYGWNQRASLVGSDVLLFSVVAPQPFMQIGHQEPRGRFPKFNFMQGTRLSQYTGSGRIAVWIWLGILGAGAVSMGSFLRHERLSALNRFALAFLFCLAFNFSFHLLYGSEPFLYAADWSYALIFLTALSLRSFAENKWLLAAMVALFAILTLNNLSFLYSLMHGLSPYIPSNL